jgi:hypothetical protein
VPVLDRGTPTPPGTLVFAPVDGRWLIPPSERAMSMHAAVAARMQQGAAASWILVPCLVSLREEFNRLAPSRDKASDGSIGDAAHAASSSDHNPDETGATPYEDSDSINEVHAIDVDDDLNLPGWSMTRCVEIIAGRHRAGADDRLQNIIWDRHIISRSWGWDSWHAYTGASPHTEHAHFSARYTTAQESDTRPWGLLAEGDDMTTKAEFISWLKDGAVAAALCDALANTDNVIPKLGNPAPGTNPDGTKINTHWALTSFLHATYAAALAAQANAARLVPLALAEAGEVPPTAEQNADAVLARLGAGMTPAEIAAKLAQVFGAQSPEIGRLMAGGTVA